MDDGKTIGLSSGNRSFIVYGVFFLLLIFGPIEPYGLPIRIAYLLAIPVLTWKALPFLGERLAMDDAANDRINRALWAMLACGLLVASYHFATEAWHTECSHRVLTRDGSECVGDDVPVKGADIGGAVMMLIFAAAAFWRSITGQGDQPSA